MRLPRWQVSALVLACSWGCTSILGDFTRGTEGSDGGPIDGANGGDANGVSDGKNGDATMNGDGSALDGAPIDSSSDQATQVDGAVPLGMLTCDQWALTTPFVVENRNGLNPTGYTTVTSFATSQTTTRIVGALDGATVFTVYSIDSSGAAPVVASVSMNTAGGRVINTTRLTGGFGVIVATPSGGTSYAFSMYVFLDSMPVTPLPTPVPLASMVQSTSETNLAAAVVELVAGTYYVAVMAQDPGASIWELFTGIAAGGVAANVTPLDTSGSSNDFQLPVAVHAGSTIYLYVESHLGAVAFYPLPDSGTTAGVVRTSVQGLGLGPVFFGGILDGVPGTSAATTNLAYLEEDANEAGTALGSLAYRASSVDNPQLPTLAASTIAFGKTYTDPAVGPFAPGGRFFGNDFVAMGAGLTSGGDPTAWVNFLWLNATGVTRGERSGATQGLLPGQATLIRLMVPAAGAIGATSAKWNVAWTQYDPSAGNSDTLNFNTLICH